MVLEGGLLLLGVMTDLVQEKRKKLAMASTRHL
jgi:hypothetical protein